MCIQVDYCLRHGIALHMEARGFIHVSFTRYVV